MYLSTLLALTIALLIAPSDVTQITITSEERVVTVNKLQSGVWDVEPPADGKRREGIYTHIVMNGSVMQRTYPEIMEGPLKMVTDHYDFIDMVVGDSKNIDWRVDGSYSSKERIGSDGELRTGGDFVIRHHESGFIFHQKEHPDSAVDAAITVEWK